MPQPEPQPNHRRPVEIGNVPVRPTRSARTPATERRRYTPSQDLGALQQPQLGRIHSASSAALELPRSQQSLPPPSGYHRESLLGLFGGILVESASLLSPSLTKWWEQQTRNSKERYGYGIGFIAIGAAAFTAGALPFGAGAAAFGLATTLYARSIEKSK